MFFRNKVPYIKYRSIYVEINVICVNFGFNLYTENEKVTIKWGK